DDASRFLEGRNRVAARASCGDDAVYPESVAWWIMTSTFAKASGSKSGKSMRAAVTDDPRWARIVARDRSAGGRFWYSVATTGVYCRPSCPSRLANPRNVALYDTLESARASGFRPCKRCHPDGPSIEIENAALVAKTCRIIEMSEQEPSLEKLA